MHNGRHITAHIDQPTFGRQAKLVHILSIIHNNAFIDKQQKHKEPRPDTTAQYVRGLDIIKCSMYLYLTDFDLYFIILK